MNRLLVTGLLVVACTDDRPPTDPPELAACAPPPWTPSAPAWGGPCRTPGDCPDTGYPTTFCEPTTGGHCTELSGPDFVAEGQPCASDPNSVGFTIGSYQQCLAACDTDSDCRPGYACTRGLGLGGLGRACLAIHDCATSGCNDADTAIPYACDGESCWLDRCAGDPCADDPLSTGTCHRAGDQRRCECVAGEHWDPDCQRCGGLECDAIDLGRLTAPIQVNRDTCEGTSRFDPTGLGCTGYAAPAPETVFQVVLPPATGATVTASPIDDFDLSLYVLEDCFDFSGTTCLFGEDAAGAEVASLANDGQHDQTIVVVVDGAQPSSCGVTQVTLEPFAFECSAIELGTFTGAPIVRDDDNCDGTDIYNPGLGNCTDGHATGSEQLYHLELPPGSSVTVTMDPAGFHAVLYAVARCGDYGAAECSAGSDVIGAGTETITLTNDGAQPASHFIVADSFNVFAACGTYNLRIE